MGSASETVNVTIRILVFCSFRQVFRLMHYLFNYHLRQDILPAPQSDSDIVFLVRYVAQRAPAHILLEIEYH